MIKWVYISIIIYWIAAAIFAMYLALKNTEVTDADVTLGDLITCIVLGPVIVPFGILTMLGDTVIIRRGKKHE